MRQLWSDLLRHLCIPQIPILCDRVANGTVVERRHASEALTVRNRFRQLFVELDGIADGPKKAFAGKARLNLVADEVIDEQLSPDGIGRAFHRRVRVPEKRTAVFRS